MVVSSLLFQYRYYVYVRWFRFFLDIR